LKHHANQDFWHAYNRLPKQVQKLVDENLGRLKSDPKHPSLHFKNIGRFWSVRIGKSWRALALKHGENFIWIGSHAEYDKFLK
jgi:hypothetical protein